MSKAENQARCRKKKTDKGLCCQCGKEKIFKAKRCETCYSKVVDATREIRKERYDKGLCTNCGKNPFEKNKKRCTECLYKQNKWYKEKAGVTIKIRKQRCVDGLCTACGKLPHEKDQKRCWACIKKNKDWYKTSDYREESIKKALIRRKERKARIFKHYGGKCACCGLKQYEFLCIDHIEGGGNEHRRSLEMSKDRCGSSSTNFYKWLEKNNYPEGFQTLCHNCNMAKSIYGACPHKQKGNK